MENFQKKNNLVTGRAHHVSHHPQVTTTSSQVIIRDICIFFSPSFSVFFLILKNLSILVDAAEISEKRKREIFLYLSIRNATLCAQRLRFCAIAQYNFYLEF